MRKQYILATAEFLDIIVPRRPQESDSPIFALYGVCIPNMCGDFFRSSQRASLSSKVFEQSSGMRLLYLDTRQV